jgi:leucyl aminopeptidase
MKISYKTPTAKMSKTDLLVIFSCKGEDPDLPGTVVLPEKILPGFKAKARATRFVDPLDGPAERVLLVGLGEQEEVDHEAMRRAAALAMKQALANDASSVTFWLDADQGEAAESLGQALTEGVVMGTYRLDEFKSDPDKVSLKKVVVHAGTDFKRGARRGEITGGGNVLARRLQDTPANRMRPRDLVSEARKIARKSSRISVEVLDEKAMKKLGMGALLAVSRGSAEPAYLIHLVYRPGKKARRKACLVGKGLTFDSGGVSIKPSARMDEMKYDMSGGAAVLGTFAALADLEPAIEVHGLVPTSENMVDAASVKPGDLVTAANGMTIEVLNTDAEGRLILADALVHAAKTIKPDVVIDLATLTGAMVVALGHELTGVMGNDESLTQDLVEAGKATGEAVWPMLIIDFHQEDMKGQVGDLKNIGSPGTGAGACTAGAFLSNFVGDLNWAHLDIAGTAWGARDRDYQGGPAGTGVGVRLLLEYLTRG